jgi:hypothetical protein
MVENRQKSNLVQERLRRIGLWAVGILIVFGPAIVKSIVERHSGQISVKSEPGRVPVLRSTCYLINSRLAYHNPR